MANKYERAAETLSHARGRWNKEDFDLATALLRAAARLPEGVDPVQVLNNAEPTCKHDPSRRKYTSSFCDMCAGLSPNAAEPQSAGSSDDASGMLRATDTALQRSAQVMGVTVRGPSDDVSEQRGLIARQAVHDYHNHLYVTLEQFAESMLLAGKEAGRKAGGK